MQNKCQQLTLLILKLLVTLLELSVFYTNSLDKNQVFVSNWISSISFMKRLLFFQFSTLACYHCFERCILHLMFIYIYLFQLNVEVNTIGLRRYFSLSKVCNNLDFSQILLKIPAPKRAFPLAHSLSNVESRMAVYATSFVHLFAFSFDNEWLPSSPLRLPLSLSR